MHFGGLFLRRLQILLHLSDYCVSNAGGGQHLIGSLEFTVVNHCGCLNTIGVTSNLPRLNVGSTLNGWLRMSEVVHLKSEICGTWKMFQIVQFLHFLCHQ